MDFAKSKLLLPMDGANNGTTFTDWSVTPKTATVNGNTITSTTQSKYYGSSGYFDGTGDYLSFPTSGAVSSSTCTIAAWIYVTSLAHQNTYFDQRAGTNDAGFALYSGTGGGLAVYGNSTGQASTAAGVITTNTWIHIAFVMDGTNQKLYINGVNTGTTPAVWTPSALGCLVGKSVDSTANNFQGYIQDFIATNEALWVADFTPPARAIGELTGNVTEGSYSAISKWIVKATKMISAPAAVVTENTVTGATYTIRAPAKVPHVITCAPYIDGQWEISRKVALGEFFVTSNPETSAHLWEVTTAGTFDTTEATWNLSGTTTQGTATMTYVGALPNGSIRGPKIPS